MLVHEVLLLHNLLVLLLDSLIDERKIVEIHLLVLHNEQFELLLHSLDLLAKGFFVGQATLLLALEVEPSLVLFFKHLFDDFSLVLDPSV